MSTNEKLRAIRAAVQRDVGDRGLTRLFALFPDDFASACRSLATPPAPTLGVVTGFWIPSAQKAETDGPLGAVYLARTLPELGIQVCLISDPFCRQAIEAGLQACGRSATVVDVPELPAALTHLLALERVGPSHTPASLRVQPGTTEETVQQFLREVPPAHHDRCHTMRGIDITAHMRYVAPLFEASRERKPPVPSLQQPAHALRSLVTIGIGDGGNEIGMGKVPWSVIRSDIPNGAIVACRVITDFLIVAGISNWGAYALAAGVAVVKGIQPPDDWFDIERERQILREMVEKGPLVDGVTGRAEESVDGLSFDEYIEPVRQIREIVRS